MRKDSFFNPALEDLLVDGLEHLRKLTVREGIEFGLMSNPTSDVINIVMSNYMAFVPKKRSYSFDEKEELSIIKTHVLSLVNQYVSERLKGEKLPTPLPLDYREAVNK